MIFSSPIFLFLFLPVSLGLYFLLPKKTNNIILLALSIAFYAWGEGRIIFVILSWIAINFFLTLAIDEDRKRAKFWLVLIVSANLGIIFYFKYLNFFIDNLSLLTHSNFQLSKIYLPLAVSFFTFHAISYNVDVFKGKNKAEQSLPKLALYLLFFPHLLAGPILRYHLIYKQLKKRQITLENFKWGITRFIIGLSKKVLIADTLSPVVEEIFAIAPSHLTAAELWLGVAAFTLQIYFDFSGYSDMAIGLAQMFGFKFPENFNYPYISLSVREFWRRWHMSLSSWFRDYLYIPLGGNRVSTAHTYFNLWIVFLLVGLWHGAGWTFVVWGIIHGTFLVLERIKNGALINFLPRPVRFVYTILVVMVGWVFFRSNSLSNSFSFILGMVGIGNKGIIYHSLPYFLRIDIFLAILFGIIFSFPVFSYFKFRINKIPGFFYDPFWQPLYNFSLLGLLIFDMLFIAAQTYQSFIYFRF